MRIDQLRPSTSRATTLPRPHGSAAVTEWRYRLRRAARHDSRLRGIRPADLHHLHLSNHPGGLECQTWCRPPPIRAYCWRFVAMAQTHGRASPPVSTCRSGMILILTNCLASLVGRRNAAARRHSASWSALLGAGLVCGAINGAIVIYRTIAIRSSSPLRPAAIYLRPRACCCGAFPGGAVNSRISPKRMTSKLFGVVPCQSCDPAVRWCILVIWIPFSRSDGRAGLPTPSGSAGSRRLHVWLADPAGENSVAYLLLGACCWRRSAGLVPDLLHLYRRGLALASGNAYTLFSIGGGRAGWGFAVRRLGAA